LDIRGSAQFAATNRSTAAGLYFPWGEVGIVTNEVASQYNVRMNGDKPLLEIFSGKTEVIWRVGEISSAGHELFQIVASPGAQVKLSREHSSGLESRDIGPKRQASFLANGSMSGSVGAVRLPPKSVATSSSAPPPAAAPVEDIPGLSILMPQMALKTEGSTIDVLLEWRFNPGARVIPCDIEMAADAELTKPLAKYQSADMRLLLKGMRPGIYFWRVSCAVDGTQQTSSTAKIQVQDGRKSAAIPILQAPANRAKISNSSVVYQWERVDSARSYVLQLSRDPKFTKMNEYYARSGTALKMNLKKRGVYYWRVYGITGTTKADRTGFSATYSFTY
jgi:hypothetical protein